MKKRLFLLAMVAAVLLSAAPVLADSDFYVIAGGGGVGTKITSLPCTTIKSPGLYYLTGNLSCSSGDGITINSDDVTIDLMGFSLTGSGSGNGININGHKNVEVRNGTLYSWSTAVLDFSGERSRAFNLRVENCVYGIMFEGIGNLVKGCTVQTTAGTGIYNGEGVTTGNTLINNVFGIVGSGMISGNSVYNCTTYGIDIYSTSSVIGNTVVTTATSQIGIYTPSSAPVLVTQNGVSGPGTHFTPGLGTVNVANTNAGF